MFRSIELPEPKCPELVYGLYPSGHRAIWRECGKWRCSKCGKKSFRDKLTHLTDMTLENEYLHHVTLPEEKVEAAKRAFRRNKAATWCIRFVDLSVVAVTDIAASGRGWETVEKQKIDVVTSLLLTTETRLIRRAGDFTRHWKPDPKAVVTGEKMIYRLVVPNQKALDATLAEFGERIDSDSLNHDPYELAEKLKNRFGQNEEDDN